MPPEYADVLKLAGHALSQNTRHAQLWDYLQSAMSQYMGFPTPAYSSCGMNGGDSLGEDDADWIGGDVHNAGDDMARRMSLSCL